MKIEFHADNGEEITPIEVANALINHTTHNEVSKLLLLIIPKEDYKTFDSDELEQIAEHLLVYCKHNKKGGNE